MSILFKLAKPSTTYLLATFYSVCQSEPVQRKRDPFGILR